MENKINYKAVIIIWLILLSILSYSFVTQTILYVFQKGEIFFGITWIIGFLVLVVGTALLAYGGYLFVTYTNLLLQGNEKLRTNIAILRSSDADKETKRKARKENFNFLVQAWKPAFIYFKLALLFVLLWAIVLNISDWTINFCNS